LLPKIMETAVLSTQHQMPSFNMEYTTQPKSDDFVALRLFGQVVAKNEEKGQWNSIPHPQTENSTPECIPNLAESSSPSSPYSSPQQNVSFADEKSSLEQIVKVEENVEEKELKSQLLPPLHTESEGEETEHESNSSRIKREKAKEFVVLEKEIIPQLLASGMKIELVKEMKMREKEIEFEQIVNALLEFQDKYGKLTRDMKKRLLFERKTPTTTTTTPTVPVITTPSTPPTSTVATVSGAPTSNAPIKKNKDDDEDFVQGGRETGEWKKKSFDERFNEIVEFKKVYGHTCPSMYDKRWKSLAVWVFNIRRRKRGVKGFKRLTSEEIQKLDTIGFVWNPRESQ